MKNKITAIVNQKGGVGKTTTALNLSYALSEEGKKVLLIDFDPQASLTVALGHNGENICNIQTLMAGEIEESKVEGEYVIKIKDNLDLIPGTLDLAGIEISLVNVMSREMILKQVIKKIENDYDYIIIDCSPSLGMLTINALAACNSIIIPVTPEYLSAKGLGLLISSINKIKKRINTNIEIDGILITMMNERTNLSKEMIKALNESVEFVKSKFNLNMKIFESKIPVSVKTGEAILNRKSIIEYEPKNKVSEAYQYFAWEWSEN
ncbi:ParA family protein [Alkaliphilus sp. B6464]|uniref:ParA family protein n=1 Tax=Alkaliphilus sp. B6464 TaxID=2731219 RepID=UPI001BA5F03F|nr:AAA family ATPase [Alkaliphilus sp. B6464]QUH20387.1 ParA family protein [Alkaliphilus sp. B6464]